MAADTETTGLDVFSEGFALRLVQFGDELGSWVIPARHTEVIREAIRACPRIVLHNATYDLLVLDQHAGLPLEETQSRSFDTRILAHILDPRAKHEGGVGHGLKDLAAYYVDPNAVDGDKALKEVFKANKWRGSTGWAKIPEDHDDYVRYAGLDTIITARLFAKLVPMMAGRERLSRFEHRLQRLLARMERRGVLVDPEYLTQLCETFTAQERVAQEVATEYGVLNVGSTAQVAASLTAMGVELTETTATGKPKVDKAVLQALVGAGNPLAKAVMEAKRASKWRTAYAESMLDLRDANDRVHPKINSLQARTARMSIARPAWQQLPSTDHLVRDGVIADSGQLIVSCDYSQVEMRLLAALAREDRMIHSIVSGVDIHDMTATALFGTDFTKAQRKIAKVVGFAKVYGGGAATIARQTGVTLDQARDAVRSYDEAFPGIKQYGYRLMAVAEKDERFAVSTPMYGRELPLDENRLYAATNYVVQSTARDVFAESLLRLEDEGLEEHLLLPVHDEVLAQAPESEAADLAIAISEVMTTSCDGVPLAAEAEVYGKRWGDGYR